MPEKEVPTCSFEEEVGTRSDIITLLKRAKAVGEIHLLSVFLFGKGVMVPSLAFDGDFGTQTHHYHHGLHTALLCLHYFSLSPHTPSVPLILPSAGSAFIMFSQNIPALLYISARESTPKPSTVLREQQAEGGVVINDQPSQDTSACFLTPKPPVEHKSGLTQQPPRQPQLPDCSL
ncbi:hypothetical protein SRHO_G00001000 [Serrasalmus rhombeus]